LAATLALLFAPAAAFAAAYPSGGNGTADFGGQGASLVWAYDNVNVAAYGYDAFGALTKDLYPGERREVTVRLRNNAPDNVEFLMAVWPVADTRAKDLADNYYAGKTADGRLLDEIMMEVTHAGALLYQGTLRGLAAGGGDSLYTDAPGKSLGTVPPGHSGVITVALSLPDTLDNSFMDTLTAIEWRFVARQLDETSGEKETPPTPPITPPPTATQPTAPTTTPTQSPTQPSAPATTTRSSPQPAPPTAAPPPANRTPPNIGDTPNSELPDPSVPGGAGQPDAEMIAENPTALFTGSGAPAWALLNLILTIVTAIIMILYFASFAGVRRKEEEGDAEYGNVGERGYEPVSKTRKRRNGARLFGVVATVAAIVLFLLAEDMRLPVAWRDEWTPYHALITILAAAAAILLPRRTRRAA
jgi:hypothetical protein